MSAFNTVRATAVCPSCKQVVDVIAQFKFGNTWQYEYRGGDTLRWGGNDVGRAGKRHVVVDAVAETPCPNCGYRDEWNLYLHVESDRIVKLETATGEHDFAKERCSYVVLRE